MDYKVDFKDSFLEDLERIVREIAVDNAEAARRLGEVIVRTSEALEFFPERHPRVRQRPELRRFIVARHYKVFYRIRHAAKSVEILRCWDGRRGTDPAVDQLTPFSRPSEPGGIPLCGAAALMNFGPSRTFISI